MAEEIMITPEITMHEEAGEICFNNGEVLEIDDDEPSAPAGTNPFEIPADISITRVNKTMPKQFIKVRNDLSKNPNAVRQSSGPVRPPPLIRAGQGLPPMPRLRLGAPRPRMMPPHIQQNPLASMFNMLPPTSMGQLPGMPPRGFVPPPSNHHMHPMGPRMRPQHHINNGNSMAPPNIMRPPQKLPSHKRSTQRMPYSHNMMIPKEPLPPMISPKGPRGPKGSNGTTVHNSQAKNKVTAPQVPQTKPLPNQVTPVQVPPPLSSKDMAAKVIQNGGNYSFQGLNITVTSVPRKNNKAAEMEEEEIDDAEEDLEEELDDDEPADVDADGAPVILPNSVKTVSPFSNGTLSHETKQKMVTKQKVVQQPLQVKVQSAVKKGLGTLKFIRTADGKGYIRRQTDNLLKNAKMPKTKKKKKFFRGANYKFDGSIVKKKSNKSNNHNSRNKQQQQQQLPSGSPSVNEESNPGDVLSYLGIQRKGSENERQPDDKDPIIADENEVAAEEDIEVHELDLLESHDQGCSSDTLAMIRKRKASDNAALVSAADMKKQKKSADDSPKLVHPLLPLANEFEEKPLSRTRPKELKNLAENLTSKLQPLVCDCNKVISEALNKDAPDDIECQAMETVGISKVGCKNKVTDKSLRRPSEKQTGKLFCDLHIQRLNAHHCCGVCGDFCAHGVFLMCRPFTKAEPHLFHKQCYAKLEKKLCIHCLSPEKPMTVSLKLSMARMPVSLLQTVGKMSFIKNKKAKMTDLILHRTDAVTYKMPNGKIISSEGLPEGLTDESLEKVLEAVEDKEKLKHITRNMVTPIKAGDTVKILQLLSLGYSPAQKLSEAGNGSPLHLAAQEGHVLISHVLVQAGGELDAIDDEQNTPLMLACIKGKANIVRYLLQAGADLTLRGDDGMTCLHLAAQNGHLECVHVILGQNNLPRKFINLQDEGGWTPLVWACENKHEEVISYLLENGADPLISDAEGNIALHWAALSGSYKTCELLMNYGCDVNATNSILETPMHIALRQDHYECTLLFLMRRARLDLKNKNDQLPVDCIVVKNPKCATIIKLSTTLQELMKDAPKSRLERIVSNDLTRGKETNPIQLVNDLDDAQEPHDYVYVKQNVMTNQVPIDRNISTLQHCKCVDNCTTEDTCNCSDLSVKSWYDLEGRLKDGFDYREPPMIFECNDLCGCNVSSCHNRVIQHGISVRLQVFRAFGMGWGARPLADIPKGSFVCEYVGEIISDSEAETREDSYLFDLDNRDGDTFCIDANNYGNVARFINHSCSPNLTPVKVFASHQDLRFPHIALFANRDIKKGEELGFDYGEKFWVIKHKYFTCHCASDKCRFSKNKIDNFLRDFYKRNGEQLPPELQSPPQQESKLTLKTSQNGTTSGDNKAKSETTSNGIKKASSETTNKTDSKETVAKLDPEHKVVIPLTKVNVKNLNDQFNASKDKSSPDIKKEAVETSSTSSTPASSRPRRSVTMKKAESETPSK